MGSHFGFKTKILSSNGESLWEPKNNLAISFEVCDLIALGSNPIALICGNGNKW